MAFKQGAGQTATAGSAAALSAANDYFCSLTIQAKTDNAGVVYIGDSTVSSSAFAFELAPGESVTLLSSEGDSVNTKQIFLDVANSNDGVTWGGISR